VRWQSEEGKADVLVQLRGIRGLPFPDSAHPSATADDRWALPRRRFMNRISSNTSASIMGWLVSVPLVLLRCDPNKREALLNELGTWPELERAEEVLFETDARFSSPVDESTLEHSLDTKPLSALSRSVSAPSGPVIGFVDLGRPDLCHPDLEMLLLRLRHIPLISLYGENSISDHPTAVLASYLGALGEAEPSRCVFESLSPDAGPFAWLAAVDRLIVRGAQIINLSYGRLSFERQRGWAALEWGIELLCRCTAVTVVAAAGQPCEGLEEGRRLHLPASAPEVLAADGEERWWDDSAREEEEEQEILLASRRDPLGGRSGSSFSAPRITARVTETFSRIPGAARNPQLVRALLLAAARPYGSDLPTPGTVEPTRLWRISASRSFAWGRSRESFEWFSPMRTPQRLAVCWREGEEGPRLTPSSLREVLHLRRGRRWVIMDLPAEVQRVRLDGAQGDWGMAWHPLDHGDVHALTSIPLRFDHAS